MIIKGNFKMFLIILFLILIILLFLYSGNNIIVVSKNNIESKKIKKDLTIVQISDTHNKKFFKDNYYLLEKIKRESPDIIVHTGDFINTDEPLDNTMLLMKELVKIAPVYAVQGNHDCFNGRYKEIKETLSSIGVIFIENKEIFLEDYNINLIGFLNNPKKCIKYVDSLKFDKDKYNLCLIHKPENFSLMDCKNFDLFLCGHTHGGQWIIPFIGSLITSDKKLFPGKWYGEIELCKTKGFINRGLGGPQFPPRINNYPEISVYKFTGK